MTPDEILASFDNWIRQASEDDIRNNCKTEGAVFFAYMKARRVRPDYCAAMIQKATGYNPGWLWKNAPPATVRHALEAYFYSRQYIDLIEEDRGRKVSSAEAMNLAIPFWRM